MRRIVAWTLIAAVVPAPGIAWRSPGPMPPALAKALNAPVQIAPGRSQIYLALFTPVNVAPANGPGMLNAANALLGDPQVTVGKDGSRTYRWPDGTQLQNTPNANGTYTSRLTEADGSQVVVVSNAEGTIISEQRFAGPVGPSQTTVNSDGSRINEWPDGTKLYTERNADGTYTTELTEADGSTVTVVSDGGGKIISEQRYTAPAGTPKVTEGDGFHTAEWPDGTRLHNVRNANGTYTSTLTEADGTRIISVTEGGKTISHQRVDAVPTGTPKVTQGDGFSVTEWPDGTKLYNERNPDGTYTSELTDSDGSTVTVVTDGGGKIIKEQRYTAPAGTPKVTEGDGFHTTEWPDGTRLHNVRNSDGTYTSTLTEADGSQVINVTDGGKTISQQRIAAPVESILDEIDATNAHIRSLPSATSLAGMPDSLPFEANPNEDVPVTRTMMVAMEDALQQAGVDTNNGGFSSNRGTNTVTFEGQNDDGDVVVTGQLIDGKLVLTKAFKPLTGSGDVGEPVRIRASGQPAATGTQTNSVQTTPAIAQTSEVQTAATNAAAGSAALPPGGRPIPADVVRQWGQDLYAQFEQEAKQVTGKRDGQGQLLDMNGQVIAPTTVAALKLVQDAVVTDLQTFTQHLQELQDLSREHKIALGKDLEDAARQLRTAAAELDRAKTAFEPFQASEQLYNNSMARAVQLEKAGDTAGAAEMRAQAEATPYGRYVAARANYVQLLNQNPLLGVKRDGKFLYEAFADNASFPTTGAATQTTIASDQRYVELLNGYLAAGIEQTKQQAAELGAYNTIEQLAVFASPAYGYVHDRLIVMGTMIGSTVTADLIGELRAASQGSLKSWSDVAWQRIVDRSLIVLQIGVMFLPGGPLLALALASAQIARAGKDTVVAYVDQQNAQQRAAATGFDQVVQTDDNLNAATKNLLWTSGLSLFDVYGATQYARLMRVMRAEQQTARAAQQGLPETTTAANAPRTNQPVRDAGSDPTAKTTAEPVGDKTAVYPDPPATGQPGRSPVRPMTEAESASADAAEAADDLAVYEANLARAQAAGVPEPRIKEIVGGAKPGDEDVANALYREALVAEGKQLDMALDEFGQAKFFQARNTLGTLTEADYAWLRNKLASDPNYLDNLPNRGRLSYPDNTGTRPIDDFEPAITPEQLGDLMKNPRVASMVDEAKAGAGAATANVADNTGTVILPGGAQAQTGTPTVRLEPDKTALLPPNGTPTVRMDPDKTALLPPDATPTLRIDSNTAPTMRVDPADATPTVRIDPNAAPTMRVDPNTAPTMRVDPNTTSTLRTADGIAQQVTAAQQRGVAGKQILRQAQAAMVRSRVTPEQVTAALNRLFAPKPVSLASLGDSGAASARNVDVTLTALGTSSGTAFTMQAVNRGNAPIRIEGEGVVLEPIGGVARQAVPASNTPGATTTDIEAFCLERLQPVAPEGAQYRVAPPDVQKRFGPLVSVLQAAQRIADAGLLRPDSTFKGYYESIRQWALWTRQEKFDEKKFTEEFLNHTKKNIEAGGTKFTNDMENVVRKVAPGRWGDIQQILDEANKPKNNQARAYLE